MKPALMHFVQALVSVHCYDQPMNNGILIAKVNTFPCSFSSYCSSACYEGSRVSTCTQTSDLASQL